MILWTVGGVALAVMIKWFVRMVERAELRWKARKP